jgi:ribosomal protein L2
MNENKHSMSIRDKIERQKEYLEKRKAEKKLSQNQNIKKSRNRLVNFTSLKRELKMKKTANRIVINRRLRSLKTTSEYINAFAKKKERMI